MRRCRAEVIVLSLVLICGWAGAVNFTIQRWNIAEIQFNAAYNYSSPYINVDDFNALFVSPTGNVMIMPGFWDGGRTWKVRFAPTAVGIWSYQTRATDISLNNQTGFINCTTYTGSLPIYQHGFIKSSTNNRYLTYADGKPFYWLGDTHWSGFSIAERFNVSNDARFSSMFKGLIDRRREQSFTVWKAETFANNNEQGNPPFNEGGPAWGEGGFFIDLNPSFWQNIDQRIQYLANSGMVISMAQGIGRSMKNASAESDHKRLARYILARYGAYPTIWITAQEYNDAYAGACGSCWANVAAYVFDLDPYKRANSMHNAAANLIVYHDQLWYSFVTLQQAHNRVDSVDYWLAQYNAIPARPILEDEANYEDIIPPYGGGTMTPKWKTRQSAWQSQIGGAFGFTYGAQGIWWGCYTVQDSNFNCGTDKDARAWNTAIDFPVGEQMSFMAHFWTSFDWWTMSPDQNAIVWIAAPSDTQKPYQKSDGNNRALVVAYLPLQLNGTVYNGTVRNLSPTGIYISQWFNPRNGAYSIIDAGWTPTATGLWHIPSQPTSTDDWVLIIQRVNGSNTSPNLVFNVSTTSSSNWNVTQTSSNVVDGDLSTSWRANIQEGFNKSWLTVDFQRNITFNTIRIIECSKRTTSYRVEYWTGMDWVLVYARFTINNAGVSFSSITGTQIRVVFISGMEDTPIICELEVYDSNLTSL